MDSIVDLLGKELVNSKHEKISTAAALEGKRVVGLYYSAHWCPPCRGFTPTLKEFYLKLKDEKHFEIIFVSSDQDEDQWKEYFGEMPWLAIPFADRKLKEKLGKAFNVTGIPMFVLLDVETGDVLTTKGRSMVGQDPSGANFPWKE